MYKLVVLVSGGGTNLQAIIDQIESGRLSGVQIAGIIASKAGIGACARAEKHRLPLQIICRNNYAESAAYDQAMLQALRTWSPDLIVLAGFLSLLGPEIVKTYPERIINIHPSLIPSFCGPGLYGLKVHQAVLDYGVKISGATVHLVDQSYDTGPIVLQQAVPVSEQDTPETLQQRIMTEAEHVMLPRAIALFAAGKVIINGRKTRIKEENE